MATPKKAPAAPTDRPELDRLAEDIKAEHGQVVTTLRGGLDHARKCGELLAKAKVLVDADEELNWSGWLRKHTSIASATDRLYRRVAEKWETIQAKDATVGTLRAAVRLAREKPATPPRRKPTKLTVSLQDFRSAMERHELDPVQVAKALADIGVELADFDPEDLLDPPDEAAERAEALAGAEGGAQ